MKNYFGYTFLFLITMSCTAKDHQSNTSEIPIVRTQNSDTAYFASGCFWCTEAVFERVNGVIDVVSGYTGGVKADPTYRQVSAGLTEHAEAVRVVYDAGVISYAELVEIFFGSHDPTTLNRQGPDVGKQYRSGIFFQTEKEKLIAEEVMKKIEESGEFRNRIVTEVTKFKAFYVAEDYHQNYYELNPTQPYVVAVSKPKVEKFMKRFNDKLKEAYK